MKKAAKSMSSKNLKKRVRKESSDSNEDDATPRAMRIQRRNHLLGESSPVSPTGKKGSEVLGLGKTTTKKKEERRGYKNIDKRNNNTITYDNDKGKYKSGEDDVSYSDSSSGKSSDEYLYLAKKEKPRTDNNEGNKGNMKDDVEFEKKLEESMVIKNLLDGQKEILNHLTSLKETNATPSLISFNARVSLKINTLQKSKISGYIRKKFSKIKFLRDAEWIQMGNQLMDGLYQELGIIKEEYRKAYEESIKSVATGIINQRRAECQRELKTVALGK